MKCAASSNDDDQLAELIAQMDARDNERDEQMRTKDAQIVDLINKLTSMSTSKPTNDDGNANENKNQRDKKRERGVGGSGGGGGGGGGDGNKNQNNNKKPKYDIKYDSADGGNPHINWKKIKKNTNWDWWHVQAWERSKLYDRTTNLPS